MANLNTDQIIKNVDFNKLLEVMLTSEESGLNVHIFENGSIDVLGSSESLNPDSVVVFKTPGMGNLDSSKFTEDFVYEHEIEYDTHSEYQYVEKDTGRVVGSLHSVIMECIRDGDMSEYIDYYEYEIRRQLG